MTHLLKIVYFFLISVVLVACGNEKIQTKSLNSLISPNYSFNQDFFYCDLNKNMSLLNLVVNTLCLQITQVMKPQY